MSDSSLRKIEENASPCQGGDESDTRPFTFTVPVASHYDRQRTMSTYPTRAKTWPVGLGSGCRKANQNRSPRPVGPDQVASMVGMADGAARGPLLWTGVGVTHRSYEAVWATVSGYPTRHTLQKG